MNGLQTLPQWREYFGQPDGALLGLMNAVYPLGKVVALLCLPYITDRWGRRWPLLFGLVTCICFSILQGLAQSLDSFVVARAFLGFFTAFLSQPSPILIAEVAYPTHRGKITALYNTFYVSTNTQNQFQGMKAHAYKTCVVLRFHIRSLVNNSPN